VHGASNAAATHGRSNRSKVKRLEKHSEEGIHECTLADKRAIRGISDIFKAQDRVKKAKAELFNAQNLVLMAELERIRLLNATAKACQLAKEAAKALSKAKDQWASILERALYEYD
jgi:hypothetical protein